jgi:hypothetical protein
MKKEPLNINNIICPICNNKMKWILVNFNRGHKVINDDDGLIGYINPKCTRIEFQCTNCHAMLQTVTKRPIQMEMNE